MSKTAQKTVLIALTGNLGRTHAALGIADLLDSLGHRVVFLGPEKLGAIVRANGYEHGLVEHFELLRVPYGVARRPRLPRPPFSDWLATFLSGVRQGRKEIREFEKQVSRIFAATGDIVATYQPSFVLFDAFLLFYYIPFWRYGIPSAALSTKPLADGDIDVPPYTSPIIPRETPLSRLQIRLAWTACAIRYRLWEAYEKIISGRTPRGLAHVLAKVNQFPLRTEWKTRPILSDLKFHSLPEIVLHAMEYEFRRSTPLDNHVHYLGPVISVTRAEKPFCWEGIPQDGTLVMGSLSTVHHVAAVASRRRFFARLIEAIRSRPSYTLLLSVGDGIDTSSFTDLPPNVRIFYRLPTIQILSKARLFITHGGANSIKEALWCGVRLLVYPERADQLGNSARVVYHNLGLRGDLRRDLPPDILRRIDRVLCDERIQACVRDMQRKFRSYDSAAALRNALSKFGMKD